MHFHPLSMHEGQGQPVRFIFIFVVKSQEINFFFFLRHLSNTLLSLDKFWKFIIVNAYHEMFMARWPLENI